MSEEAESCHDLRTGTHLAQALTRRPCREAMRMRRRSSSVWPHLRFALLQEQGLQLAAVAVQQLHAGLERALLEVRSLKGRGGRNATARAGLDLLRPLLRGRLTMDSAP